MLSSRQRGDTIVEVLLAIGVLGVVLSTSAVIINRNAKTNLATQERGQAVRIAERQLELFKLGVANDINFFSKTTGTFCLSLAGKVVQRETASCTLSASSLPTTEQPGYTVGITTSDPTFRPGPNPDSRPEGRKVRIVVEWDSAISTTRDRVESWAEVYQDVYE